MNFSQPNARRPALTRMSMTPMIDVTFLLLVFFLVSTSQSPPESSLSQGLQAVSASAGSTSDLERQSLEIVDHLGAPAYRVGSRTVRTQDELAPILSALPKEQGIFVEGSDSALALHAAEAIQACRDAGFTKVTYVPTR